MHILSHKSHHPVLVLPIAPLVETDSSSVVRHFATLKRCIKSVKRFMHAYWNLGKKPWTEEEERDWQYFGF